MEKTSVPEILLNNKKWIESSKFVDLIQKKRGFSNPRQAYNLILQALKKKEILKIILPDRTVIYGLPEFGSPFQNMGSQDFQKLITVLEQLRDIQAERALLEYYENAPRQ